MDERKILGKNLRRFRLFLDIKPEELAKKVGLSKDTILRLERGEERFTKNIGLDYLLKITKVLEVNFEELFIENPKTIPLRLVISEHNIEILREIIKIIKNQIEKKEE